MHTGQLGDHLSNQSMFLGESTHALDTAGAVGAMFVVAHANARSKRLFQFAHCWKHRESRIETAHEIGRMILICQHRIGLRRDGELPMITVVFKLTNTGLLMQPFSHPALM